MTTHLTNTQKSRIRVALATFEGWKQGTPHTPRSGLWISPSNTAESPYIECLPNYPESLDACHQIEVKLKLEDRKEFYRKLKIIVVRSNIEINNDHELHMACVSAPAEHRSLALFLSLNLGELGE